MTKVTISKEQGNDWIDKLWKWADENNVPDLHLKWVEAFEVEYHEMEMTGVINKVKCWRGLPRNKEKLLSLTKLDLVGNQLTQLPKEIGNLANLTELRLDGNKLTEVPEEIGNLTNLSKLWLRF
ncbi:Leucine Rich repeats (2 copies) [Candidatus Methanoperedenaceae archaeon GB50]|nr:Leucine Rich repeats (2 copies) [Candidatus Methanoperedenaceae archaeon GB50]